MPGPGANPSESLATETMIRLTKQTDYGIVLMSQIAASDVGRHTASDLAAQTMLPQPMVSKILKLLARDGLLASHRGAKGGYSLGRDAEQITVAAIISALEGPIAITECTTDTPHECSYEATCRVRGNWQQINNAVRGALEGVSLAEMAHSPLPEPTFSSSSLV